jgi:hypothetical protein
MIALAPLLYAVEKGLGDEVHDFATARDISQGRLPGNQRLHKPPLPFKGVDDRHDLQT